MRIFITAIGHPAAWLLTWMLAGDPLAANEPIEGPVDASGDAATTLVYGKDYFALHPNALTALDIIRRIPTGNQILSLTQTSQRGFSTNEDRILVNGRRITGKKNDSISVLSRISLEQVERIEIIRGESPDIRVSAGEAIVNVVLVDKKTASSGWWQLMAEAVEGVDLGYNGSVSWNGRNGRLQYVLSAERVEQVRTFRLDEQWFDGQDALLSRMKEVDKVNYVEHALSASLNYQVAEDSELRLNISYLDPWMTRLATGHLLEPRTVDSLEFIGNSSRYYDVSHPIWELGGDYETALGGNRKLKLLGLYSRKDQVLALGEDFLVEDGEPMDDFRFGLTQLFTESIARATLSWPAGDRHELELGTEVAINSMDSATSYQLRENGILNTVPLPGSELSIREVRDESFFNYTFRPSQQLSIASSMVVEWSEIRLREPGASVERDFLFFKPALDLRYDFTPRDQFQAQIRRRVDQLDFSDFAASATIDQQTWAGNTGLEQSQRWIFETGYERRFADDGGRFMVKVRYHDITDYVDLVPVEDGSGQIVAAMGNVPKAELWQLVLESSVRMSRFDLPGLVIESRLLLTDSRVEDAFTGETHGFAFTPDYQLRIEVRNDLSERGFSYGGRVTASGGAETHDVAEWFDMEHELFFGLFAEYQLIDGVSLRVDLNDLSNYDRGWNRYLYADGTVSGVVTMRSRLKQREGLVVNVALSGSF